MPEPYKLSSADMARIVLDHLSPSEATEIGDACRNHAASFSVLATKVAEEGRLFSTEKDVALELLHIARAARKAGVA